MIWFYEVIILSSKLKKCLKAHNYKTKKAISTKVFVKCLCLHSIEALCKFSTDGFTAIMTLFTWSHAADNMINISLAADNQ